MIKVINEASENMEVEFAYFHPHVGMRKCSKEKAIQMVENFLNDMKNGSGYDIAGRGFAIYCTQSPDEDGQMIYGRNNPDEFLSSLKESKSSMNESSESDDLLTKYKEIQSQISDLEKIRGSYYLNKIKEIFKRYDKELVRIDYDSRRLAIRIDNYDASKGEEEINNIKKYLSKKGFTITNNPYPNSITATKGNDEIKCSAGGLGSYFGIRISWDGNTDDLDEIERKIDDLSGEARKIHSEYQKNQKDLSKSLVDKYKGINHKTLNKFEPTHLNWEEQHDHASAEVDYVANINDDVIAVIRDRSGKGTSFYLSIETNTYIEEIIYQSGRINNLEVAKDKASRYASAILSIDEKR